MGSHIVNGQFQSDKYPTCPPGKVPLSVKDTTAQDLLWEYAQRRRVVDAEFAYDLETALKAAGYRHEWGVWNVGEAMWASMHLRQDAAHRMAAGWNDDEERKGGSRRWEARPV
jgi:hypothetical protein